MSGVLRVAVVAETFDRRSIGSPRAVQFVQPGCARRLSHPPYPAPSRSRRGWVDPRRSLSTTTTTDETVGRRAGQPGVAAGLPPGGGTTACWVALGAAAGFGLVRVGWAAWMAEGAPEEGPWEFLLPRPLRCAECRGMGWRLCGGCRGRGKTGCPPLAAALARAAAADGGGGTATWRTDADRPAAGGSAARTVTDERVSKLSYCRACAGRGRCPCAACRGTGIENNWLYGPAENGGWGARGEWPDPENPPPMPPVDGRLPR